MTKKRNSGKLGIFLAIVSAIPAILGIFRAVKDAKRE